MRATRAVSLFALLLLPLLACDRSAKKSAPREKARCTAFGDRCEYAPGKLGACVIRDDCAGEDCFVCQSQH